MQSKKEDISIVKSPEQKNKRKYGFDFAGAIFLTILICSFCTTFTLISN